MRWGSCQRLRREWELVNQKRGAVLSQEPHPEETAGSRALFSVLRELHGQEQRGTHYFLPGTNQTMLCPCEMHVSKMTSQVLEHIKKVFLKHK